MQQMKKLRWGVLGAGGIADRRTMPGMMQCANAELVAVMERDPDKASHLRDKYHARRAYTDDAQLVRDPEVDAVYIASPVYLHARQAMMAADAGKHILLEKPLALTAREGREVLAHCDARGVRVAAGLMMRFGACVGAMREAVRMGKIGDVVSVSAQFTCWYPDIQGAWRQEKSLGGGGTMMDMGIHVVDLIRFITGQEITQLAGMHGTNTFSYEVEDSACALLRLANGALCSLHANFNVPDPASDWRLSLYGTKGHLIGKNVIGQEDTGTVSALFLSEAGGYNARQDAKAPAPEILPVAFGNLYAREIERFGDAILFGTALDVPAEEALIAQEIIEAAYRSNDTGTIVSL